MAKGVDWKQIERGMAAAMREGSVSVPSLLLKLYRAMKLSDMEAMLLIHLFQFKEKEGNDFPTPEELQGRMSATYESVLRALQRLLKEEMLQIDGETDPVSGVLSERYNLSPLYRKLAAAWIEDAKQSGASSQQAAKAAAAPAE
ncbi:MAG: initiation of chromosome replication, partial [Paenibacillus sp.]|nr:initiation of chromosome replication [Paenibacillus sp.]